MGEYAEMMLEGTCCEGCGEYMGDGPGHPRYCSRQCAGDRGADRPTLRISPSGKKGKTPFEMPAALRSRVESLATLTMLDPYHWQVRKDGRMIADWWPHKNKFRVLQIIGHGDGAAFVVAIKAALQKET